MRTEFLFRLRNNIELLNLDELADEMAEIIARKVISDFREMDSVMVEIYDIRQQQKDPSHKLSTLGRMSFPMVLQKFR